MEEKARFDAYEPFVAVAADFRCYVHSLARSISLSLAVVFGRSASTAVSVRGLRVSLPVQIGAHFLSYGAINARSARYAKHLMDMAEPQFSVNAASLAQLGRAHFLIDSVPPLHPSVCTRATHTILHPISEWSIIHTMNMDINAIFIRRYK